MVAQLLLEQLPAYKKQPFRYDIRKIVLEGKTEGQVQRLQANLTKLQQFPLVSGLFLEG